jgi:hypothetical protein
MVVYSKRVLDYEPKTDYYTKGLARCLEQFVFINEFEMTIFFKGKQAILMWRTTK